MKGGGKMKEGGHGKEAIENTRWEGDKTVGVERVRKKDEERNE